MVIPVLGDPVVVDGDWNDVSVLLNLLNAEAVTLHALESTSPLMSMLVDSDGKAKQLDVNKIATTLLGMGAGEYVAGPALIVGSDRRTFLPVELSLLDLIRLGARLVRAERTALT